MHIQWYPGHMHKARKAMVAVIPKVDLVIEVLDARLPFSSENPLLARLRGNKPCIKILNKNDLADPEVTATWQSHLDSIRGVKTLAVSIDETEKISILPDLCRKLVAEKRSSIKDIQAMIVGIPNVGKSTLINRLAGKTVAKTGNEPAVTRAQQRISLGNGLTLLDTPGMLWPKVENRQSGYRLASVGSIKNTAMEHTDVAFFLSAYLLTAYPDRLRRRYELEDLPASELEFLETVGAKRGCLRGGGQVDLEKVSTLLLNEFRAGALGGISLETPEMIEQEVEELAKKSARSHDDS